MFIFEHPDGEGDLDQLAYAGDRFSTYNIVDVRQALEDGVQAVLSGAYGSTSSQDTAGG